MARPYCASKAYYCNQLPDGVVKVCNGWQCAMCTGQAQCIVCNEEAIVDYENERDQGGWYCAKHTLHCMGASRAPTLCDLPLDVKRKISRFLLQADVQDLEKRKWQKTKRDDSLRVYSYLKIHRYHWKKKLVLIKGKCNN